VEYLVRGRYVLTMQERFGTDGIANDGVVSVSGKHIIEVAISRRSPDGDGGESELLPYALPTIKPGTMSRWSGTL
jgi:hypothetical protein